jgi:hypothetical protein
MQVVCLGLEMPHFRLVSEGSTDLFLDTGDHLVEQELLMLLQGI